MGALLFPLIVGCIIEYNTNPVFEAKVDAIIEARQPVDYSKMNK
jgi:hypothetical protein